MIKFHLLWLLLFFNLLGGCDKKEGSAPSSKLPSCFDDRATVQVVTNQQGILKYEGGIIIIVVENSNEQLAPCNLPDGYKEDDRVIFSGNKKEIYPNERWAGQPFELTSIRQWNN